VTDAAVSLRNVAKRFGDFVAVEPLSLDIPQGSFLTLLGPSGCGKTTTLRMIAGLLDPSEGDIEIKGRRVNDVPIHKRNLGIVFQNYALFPHKTIHDNVAFGLKYRDVPKAEVASKVRAALDLVQLPQVADRYPAQLSGGQQQRIALARAVVTEPDVLLLDEPLSALDANLREDMRVELKLIQTSLGITTVFVTHDQAEALAMSDRIVVMSAGRVEQVGDPQSVYNAPASEFVAQFLGASNIVPARVGAVSARAVIVTLDGFGSLDVPRDRAADVTEGDKVKLVIRAEKLLLRPAGAIDPASASVAARVETVDYQGQAVRYFVRAGERQFQVLNMIDERPFAAGESVSLHLRGRDCAALPA
jgi:spermidine/putrescine transport system ATP-binding protein